MLYQQILIGQNAQNQIQREIEYYIYQDLENALCQLGQLEETIEQLEKSKDKSYLPIAMNKVILQANLSFGIHFDQYSQHNKTQGNFLQQCKTNAKSIFEEALNKEIIKNTHPKVKEICTFYFQKIFDQKKMDKYEKQLLLEKVEIQSQFNQKALEKVIWGTQIVDKQLKQVQNQEYKPPTAQEIFEKIKKSKKYCGEQLQKNFNATKNDLAEERKDQKTKIDNQPQHKNKQQIEAQQTMEKKGEKEYQQQNEKILNQQEKQNKNKSEIQQEQNIKQTPTQKCVDSNSKPIKNQNQDISQLNKINKVESSRRTQPIDMNVKVDQSRSKTQGAKGKSQIIQKHK